MLKVAARFGVSSSYMARVCALLNVPRPERGYWAKLAVGKAPKQPPLPEPRPGDPFEWARDGTLPKRARTLPRPPERKPRQKLAVPPQLPDRHPLVSGAKPLFEVGRLSWRSEYLKPAKKLLVDLAVTKSALDKALAWTASIILSGRTTIILAGRAVMIVADYCSGWASWSWLSSDDCRWRRALSLARWVFCWRAACLLR